MEQNKRENELEKPLEEEMVAQEGLPVQEPPPKEYGDGLEDDLERVKLLENEIAQSEASLDADFIAEFIGSLSEEEQELMYGDVGAFLTLYEERKGQWASDKIGTKRKELEETKGSITQKEQGRAIDGDRERFLSEYPNADLVAMRKFYEEELPPRKQKEIQALGSPYEFYKALYELAQGGGADEAKGEVEGEKVPLRVEGASSSANQNRDVSATGAGFFRKI